jgi:hypothetical protein
MGILLLGLGLMMMLVEVERLLVGGKQLARLMVKLVGSMFI